MCGGSSAENADWIPEEEVSLDRLRRLFEAAFGRVEPLESGELRVNVEGASVFVELRSDMRFIRYTKYLFVRRKTDPATLHGLAARFNRKMSIVRFFALCGEHDFIGGDYLICYDGGVSASGLVEFIRLFQDLVFYTASEFDSDGVLS